MLKTKIQLKVLKKISARLTNIDCQINLPASKSESNRLLIIRALTKKPFPINNLSDADDTVILDDLLKSTNDVLNCGSGGTTFRFLLALLALKGERKLLTCSPQLKLRPVKPLVDALIKLGANINYAETEGFPPLIIDKGDFSNAKSIEIEANISSQFVSALLLIAPSLPNGLTLNLTGKILSKPYIELTLGLMQKHGIKSTFIYNTIRIEPQQYMSDKATVGADWSAASYFYELAALIKSATIDMPGLNLNAMQGDKVIADLMIPFGIQTEQNITGIKIIKSEIKRPVYFEYDFTDCPDLAQTFAFLCAGLGMEAKLNGIENLIHKETNRVQAIANEISKMGTSIVLSKNSITIMANAKPKISNITFNTYEDHRMAMAIAPLTTIYGSLNLDRADVVTKSFPSYWISLEKCGFKTE